MNDYESNLRNLVLAPYILKAMALIKVGRISGGNQFRHSFSILGILFDYKYFNDSVLLKASLLHDYLEDLEESTVEEIRGIDSEGPEVVKLVLEVTKQKWETKPEYLQRILDTGSENALILKCSDRISNLTDLHQDTHSDEKISDILNQTEQFVIPMAQRVNNDMVTELTDLVSMRRKIIGILDADINGE